MPFDLIDGLDWFGRFLLTIPMIYTCNRLVQAFRKEREAEREKNEGQRQLRASEARNLASVSSLFPAPVLFSLALGLGVSALVLVIQFLELL